VQAWCTPPGASVARRSDVALMGVRRLRPCVYCSVCSFPAQDQLLTHHVFPQRWNVTRRPMNPRSSL
jgi:hypothetical protein